MPAYHYIHSSLRERLIEHLFIGEVLKYAWQQGMQEVEVSKPEVDNGGYDVVFEYGGIIRHVQLKSTYIGSKNTRQKVNIALAQKPSGCVVWVFFNQETLALGPFLFFGGRPGKKLPDVSKHKTAKHTKGDSTGMKKERPNIRILNKGDFTTLETLADVVKSLFGNRKR
jgi:hypothetical protein